MTDKPDSTEPRLEAMLRRWGAEEAARSAEAPPAPGLAPRRPVVALVLRWVPTAAAAAMLVAAAGLYVAARPGGPQAQHAGIIEEVPTRPAMPPTRSATVPTQPARPPHVDEIDRLNDRIVALQGLVSERDSKLKSLAELPAQVRDLQTQLDRERKRHQSDVKEFLASVQAGKKAAADLTTKLTAAEKRIASLEKDNKSLAPAAAELPKATSQVKDLRARLAAAVGEMERNRKGREKADADAAETRRQIALLKARHAATVAAFQRTYLASVAPGEQGLYARKTAVKARRMIERVAAMSAEAEAESTRRLLGRLEVVLTRLELLDPARGGARESFARLLARSGLEKEIDDVLAAGAESPNVRWWLFEASLILMGATRAG